MSEKCKECSKSVARTWYCVQCNKQLCRRCIGRLHVAEDEKTRCHIIEELDRDHKAVQEWTGPILNVIMLGCIGHSLYHSGVMESYAAGTNICPSVQTVRRGLIYFDPNFFVYMKVQLSKACDVEDSFWRLLLDGWVRGICAGRDSFPLLLTTLPMAFAFKTTVSIFLRPLLAFLYAFFATLIFEVLVVCEDIVVKVSSILFCKKAGPSFSWLSYFYPAKLTAWVMTSFHEKRGPFLKSINWIFLALSFSASLRLVVRMAGTRYAPELWHRLAGQVNVWQLSFEPILYYYIAKQAENLEKKLAKYFKKDKAATAAPLTLWRERPWESYTEEYNYRWGRVTRQVSFYKVQADALVHLIVDDVFNTAVVIRLLFIVFNLSFWLKLATNTWVDEKYDVLQKTNDWFYDNSGFVEEGKLIGLNMYPTDWAFSLSVGVGGGAFREASTFWQDVFTFNFKEIDPVSTSWEATWRILVPYVIYSLERWWLKLNKKQKATFDADWKGRREQFKVKGNFFAGLDVDIANELDKAKKPTGKKIYSVKSSPEDLLPVKAQLLSIDKKPVNESLLKSLKEAKENGSSSKEYSVCVRLAATPWKDGEYGQYMAKYGAYWDTVPEAKWKPDPKPELADAGPQQGRKGLFGGQRKSVMGTPGPAAAASSEKAPQPASTAPGASAAADIPTAEAGPAGAAGTASTGGSAAGVPTASSAPHSAAGA